MSQAPRLRTQVGSLFNTWVMGPETWVEKLWSCDTKGFFMFYIIGGATGTGKSSVAIELAKKINGEIISADSMQIYEGMDIGTYKTPVKDRGGIPHHLIDIVKPGENFSASAYKRDAEIIMDGIKKRGRIPIIAGGTGLYITAIIKGLMPSAEPDGNLRAELRGKFEKQGLGPLVKLLEEKDPEAAKETDLKNSRRVIRALELIISNGMKLSDIKKKTAGTAYPDDYKFFVLSINKEKLYPALDTRVDNMIKQGLFAEVEALLKSGLPVDSTAFQAIGYKESVEYLNKKAGLPETVEKIKNATRHYAKRQVTWFKKYGEAMCLDAYDATPASLAAQILNNR